MGTIYHICVNGNVRHCIVSTSRSEALREARVLWTLPEKGVTVVDTSASGKVQYEQRTGARYKHA